MNTIDQSEMKQLGENMRGSGFGRVILGITRCTRPWSRLQAVGLSTIEDKFNYCEGSTTLVINQGGVRNREVTKNYKKVFQKEIFPSIHAIRPEWGDNYTLKLSYTDGLLIRVERILN